MSKQDSFHSYIRRIRQGQSEDIQAFVARYEPLIRTEVRLRIRDARLYRQFDSVDVSQSVIASFLIRTAAGQFEITDHEQLAKLLLTMARRKAALYARQQRAQKRDHRRIAKESVDGLVDKNHSPSQIVANAELIREFRRRLSKEEREIADFRADGKTWAEIAEQFGGTPNTRRTNWSRTILRITRELGIRGDDDE